MDPGLVMCFFWLFLVKIRSDSFLDYLHIMEIYGYPRMRPKPQNSWVIKSLTMIVPSWSLDISCGGWDWQGYQDEPSWGVTIRVVIDSLQAKWDHLESATQKRCVNSWLIKLIWCRLCLWIFFLRKQYGHLSILWGAWVWWGLSVDALPTAGPFWLGKMCHWNRHLF